MRFSTFKILPRAWLLLAAVLVLSGCGGGSGASSTSSSLQSSGLTGSSSQDTRSTSSPPPVIPSNTGSFSLSWTAPVTRADGEPLSLADINGYRVYYGTSRGSYPNQVNITDGAATRKTINNLAPGKRYYLVMTTYDNAGRESAPSPEVAKTAI
jgi:hypothetical protein